MTLPDGKQKLCCNNSRKNSLTFHVLDVDRCMNTCIVPLSDVNSASETRLLFAVTTAYDLCETDEGVLAENCVLTMKIGLGSIPQSV